MRKIRIILVIIFFVFIFCFLNQLLKPKYSTSLIEGSMIREYYDEKKDHEVIFIGDCEVYANFSPMVLYEQYGIKSYIRGSSQQLIWQSYYILKETLKYEIPKVVILNVNAMRYEDPVSEAYNHLTTDYMKWSKEKIDLIKTSLTEDDNFLYYLFPLLRYHDRYDELNEEDIKYLFKKKKNTFNGFLVNQNVKPANNLPTKKVLGNYDFSKSNYEYLDKIVEICKKNNIELILIKAPSLYPYWYDEYNNQIEKYAKNKNIDYYNFTTKVSEIGIDYSTDTYDAGLHLNLSGATKLSKYFGKILSKNYNLKNYKNDPIYNKKLKEYKQYIKNQS